MKDEIEVGDIVRNRSDGGNRALVTAVSPQRISVVFEDLQYHKKWGLDRDGTAPFMLLPGDAHWTIVQKGGNPHADAAEYYMAVTGDSDGQV